MAVEVLDRPSEGAEVREKPLILSSDIRSKRVLLFGYGKVGKALLVKLFEEGIEVTGIVRSSGVFNDVGEKVAEHDSWKKFVTGSDAAFIAIPTVGEGEEALRYTHAFLTANKPVITAEKASLASNPSLLKDPRMGFSATVGGGTKMPKVISEFLKKEPIDEIKAVVNGTLNYISDRVRAGASESEAIREAVEKGYAETDTDSFDVILADEGRDVIRKAVIIANHSGIFNHSIHEHDVTFIGPHSANVEGNLGSKRVIVRINQKEGVIAGFIERGESNWLPEGVNNVLYINGEQVAHGPGAGAETTADTMMQDFRDIVSE